MTLTRSTVLAALVLAAAACGSSDDSAPNPCTGFSGTGTCVGFPEGTPEATIASAFAQAAPGTTLWFAKGTFRFTNSLQLGADGVTVRGAGREDTLLDFGGTVGPEGIGAEGVKDLTIRDLGVADVNGNGVKVTSGDGVHVQGVKVLWRNPDTTTHGGYGIYPVLSRNVLVEDCYTQGASDTGIYVGQSQDIVVRNNEATGNVAGIEIENCVRADVYGNHVHDNAGGVLAFNLPLPVLPTSNQVRIFQNRIESNDGVNFAPAGNIVAMVPKGTGVIVMANHDVEIFENTLSGNGTVAVAIASYLVTGEAPPAGYDPYPGNVHVHGNTFSNNGTAPDQTPGGLGWLLDLVAGDAPIPDHVWDGFAPEAGANPLQICIGAAGSGILDLNARADATYNSALTDPAPFQCALAPLPAVALP